MRIYVVLGLVVMFWLIFIYFDNSFLCNVYGKLYLLGMYVAYVKETQIQYD